MSDEQTDILPATPPDAFAAALALIAIALDPKATEARLRSLREHEGAAAKASARLAIERADFQQHCVSERAALESDRAAVEKRRGAAHAAEGLLAEREKRQAALEKLWADYGEPSEVLSGFKDPEQPALHKAARAHGFVDEDAPQAPLREDSGGQPFPPDSTITHTPASPARRAMRNAAEL